MRASYVGDASRLDPEAARALLVDAFRRRRGVIADVAREVGLSTSRVYRIVLRLGLGTELERARRVATAAEAATAELDAAVVRPPRW